MEVDAKGLCAIIKACHNAGVSRLKFGDVDVTFCQDTLVNNVSQGTLPQALLQEGQVSMELSADQTAIMEEAEEADLMISEPTRWEDVMVDRLVYKDRALDEHRPTERPIQKG